RRNLVALCPSLANGTSTTQLLLMGSLLYSTKPGMRRRLGMDKIPNPLAKTPGLRGWKLMPPSYFRLISLFHCAEEVVLLRDAKSYTIL
uniref:Uncharacterized protein n=1 Tax=Aegilops tauschii subsp. strangulata TaxID=200361 RepID=A0A453RCX7_AEGTS